MTFKIHRISAFKDKVYGSCVDIIRQPTTNSKQDKIHFIFPNDEYYLSSPRFAFNLKADWKPNLEDFTIDYFCDLFDFLVLFVYFDGCRQGMHPKKWRKFVAVAKKD